MSNLFTSTITFNDKDWHLSNEGYSGRDYYLPHITSLPNLDLGSVKGGYFGVKLGSLGILNKPQDKFSPFSIYTGGYEKLLNDPNRLIPCKIYWGEQNVLIFDGDIFLKKISVADFKFQLRAKTFTKKLMSLVTDAEEELAEIGATSITHSGSTVTVFAASHELVTGDRIFVRDAAPITYNVENEEIVVLDDNRFTYTVSSLSSTGSAITYTVQSNEKREVGWVFGDVKFKGPLVMTTNDNGHEFANPGLKWQSTDSTSDGYIDTSEDNHLQLFDSGILVGTSDNTDAITTAGYVAVHYIATNGATLIGNLLYLTTVSSHSMTAGSVIELLNFTSNDFNVITIIQSVPSANQFTCVVNSSSTPGVINSGGGGSINDTKVYLSATYFGDNRLPSENTIKTRQVSQNSNDGVVTIGEVHVSGSSAHGKTIYNFFEYVARELEITNVDFSFAPNSEEKVMQLYSDKDELLIDYAGKIAEGCNHVFVIGDDTLKIIDLSYVPEEYTVIQNTNIIAMSIEMARPVKAVVTEFDVMVPMTMTLPTSIEEQKRFVRVDNLNDGKEIKVDSVTDNLTHQREYLLSILDMVRKPRATVQYGGIDIDLKVGQRLKFSRDEHQIDVDMLVREIKYDFSSQFTTVVGDSTLTVISQNENY